MSLGDPRLARRVALALTLLLIAELALWHGSRLSPGAAAAAIGLLVTPWVLVLPGLVGNRRRSYQAGAILTAPYLAYGTMEVLANPGARRFAGATVLVAFALFVALVHFLRTSQRPAR